ncbi:MAG: ABC transporter permease [Candidatus Dojkabacteria bacterium]|nr:ABC transporter permease [Candidatus Dojkabacteria bacterium]
MKNIITIWKKELKDAIRDRRTLMAMIVMPMVLMPMIIVGMFKLIDYQVSQSKKQEVKIAVQNREKEENLVGFISAQENLVVVDAPSDLSAAVKDKEIDLAVLVPFDIGQRLKAEEPVSLQILGHSLNSRSEVAFGRVSQAVTAYNSQILASRFKEQKVSGSILTGITVERKDVATSEEIGGFGLGYLLPLFIVMWANVGGQYIAIDVSAGEKERKTLEALLLTPVKRIEIVFGKFLAVATSALTSVVISLAGIYVVINHFGLKLNENGNISETGTSSDSFVIDFSVEPAALLVILIVSILLVLVFSAMLLSISIFAKSYKEAQNYLGPSYMFIILPVVIVNSIPDFKPPLGLFAVPAVNAILLFKEVLIGVYDWGHIITTAISLAVFALSAVFIATRIYSNEKVLFRS